MLNVMNFLTIVAATYAYLQLEKSEWDGIGPLWQRRPKHTVANDKRYNSARFLRANAVSMERMRRMDNPQALYEFKRDAWKRDEDMYDPAQLQFDMRRANDRILATGSHTRVVRRNPRYPRF